MFIYRLCQDRLAPSKQRSEVKWGLLPGSRRRGIRKLKGVIIIGSIEQVARALQALGQDMRLKILKVLAADSHCVCELESILGVSQPAISHHLGVLKDAGLVESMREGQWIFYKINRAGIENVLRLLSNFLLDSDMDQFPEIAEIMSRVEEIKKNPRAVCRRTSRG